MCAAVHVLGVGLHAAGRMHGVGELHAAALCPLHRVGESHAAAPAACARSLRGTAAGVRLCADAAVPVAVDEAKSLKEYVAEIRTAKAALRRGLQAEGGVLSEDGLALALGLAQLNPTAPNPADDTDLWEGKEFTLLSSALPLLGAPPPLRHSGGRLRVEKGAATFELVIFEAPFGVAALLDDESKTDVDYASARANVRLRMIFKKNGAGTLAVQVAKAGIQITGRPGGGAMAAVAMASVAAESSWDLAPDADPADEAAERVLVRAGGVLPLAEARLSLLYLDQDLAIVGWAEREREKEEAPQFVCVFGL